MPEECFQTKQGILLNGLPVAVIEILNSIDGSTIFEFREILNYFFSKEVRNFLVLFTEVMYINSPGTELLFDFHNHLESIGGIIILSKVSEEIMDLFDRLQISSILRICNDEKEIFKITSQVPIKLPVSIFSMSKSKKEIKSADTWFRCHHETLPNGEIVSIIRVFGKITKPSALKFQAKIINAYHKGNHVILSLQETTEIDSLGMGLLVNLMDKFEEKGSFQLVSLPERIAAIFNMLGLSSLFKISDTVQEALSQIISSDEDTKNAMFESKCGKRRNYVQIYTSKWIDKKIMSEYKKNRYWLVILILLIVIYIGSYLHYYKDPTIIVNDSDRTPIDLGKAESEHRIQKYCGVLFYPLIKIECIYRNWQRRNRKTIWSK